MSDGGGESGRKRKFGGNDFSFAVAKIAVAQICESAGFHSVQHSALETLSDIAVRYIHSIGKAAHCYANLAGREEGNVFDIIQGLEDLGSGVGFAGASDFDHCLTASGVVRETIQYVADAGDIPFAYSLPRFPVVRDRKHTSSFLQTGKEPPSNHIPAWLPAFPDPDTYVQLPTGNEKTIVSQTEKNKQERNQKKTEKSLLNLQQRFACNGLEGPSLINGGDAVKAREMAESNPYLAAPLHFGEKEVASVVPPGKYSNEVAAGNPVVENLVVGNRISVMETFAPAIEAMKSGFYESGAGQRKVPLNQRPVVHFKIGMGKKSFVSSLGLTSQKKGCDKISPWFGNDNEKDDKKRRAEHILNESTENSKELA